MKTTYTKNRGIPSVAQFWDIDIRDRDVRNILRNEWTDFNGTLIRLSDIKRVTKDFLQRLWCKLFLKFVPLKQFSFFCTTYIVISMECYIIEHFNLERNLLLWGLRKEQFFKVSIKNLHIWCLQTESIISNKIIVINNRNK